MEMKNFNIIKNTDIPILVDIKEVPISRTSINQIYEYYINEDTTFKEIEMIGGVVLSYDDYKTIESNPHIRNNVYDLCEKMILNYNNKHNYPQDRTQYVSIFVQEKRFSFFKRSKKENLAFLVYIKNGQLEKLAFVKPFKK